MTLKRSSRPKPHFVVILMLFSLTGCSPPSPKPVRLDDLRTGISINERIRLKVKDITVGEISVRHLFRSMDQREPSWWEYYSGKRNDLSLIVDDPKKLQELRIIVAARHPQNLRVILEDNRSTVLRRIFPNRFDNIIEIPFAPTPCEEISRIIYKKINSAIKEQSQLEGETDKHIDLDQMFNLLLRDEIEPYMNTLDKIKTEDTCFTTFQLLKWLKSDDAAGFELGEYYINEGLRGLLQPVIDALVYVKSGDARHRFQINVIGYTDLIVVGIDRIDLRLDKTGIDDWSQIEDPLDIRYSGCSNDRLDKKPVYLSLRAKSGQQIKLKVRNNCELGAVRAYVAMVYLISKLGQSNAEFNYATGGIYLASDTSRKEDPQKRKVKIDLIIKAARTE